MPDDDACYLLSSWAKQVTTVILQICRDARRLPSAVRCAAGQIATWLKTVSPYIDSLPRYWIEPELENLCLEVLKRLAEMCAVRYNTPHLLDRTYAHHHSGLIVCTSQLHSPFETVTNSFFIQQPKDGTPRSSPSSPISPSPPTDSPSRPLPVTAAGCTRS